MKEIKVLVITKTMEKFLEQYRGAFAYYMQKGEYIITFNFFHRKGKTMKKVQEYNDIGKAINEIILEVEQKHNDMKVLTIEQYELIQKVLGKIRDEMTVLGLEDKKESMNLERFCRDMPIKDILKRLDQRSISYPHGSDKMWNAFKAVRMQLAAFKDNQASMHNCKVIPSKQFSIYDKVWNDEKKIEQGSEVWKQEETVRIKEERKQEEAMRIKEEEEEKAQKAWAEQAYWREYDN